MKLHANMLTSAAAWPPLNRPLEGVTTNDHGCGVPSQTIALAGEPEPDMVATRPTDWLRFPKTNADAPVAHEAVPVTVAAPDFESKLPDESTVKVGFGAASGVRDRLSVPPDPVGDSTRSR